MAAAIEYVPPIEERPYEPAHSNHEIAERLRLVLTYVNWTPEDMARAIGAPEPDVLDWVEGNYKPPTRMMLRLSRRVGLTLTWIYYGDSTGLVPGIAARLLKPRRDTPPAD